MCARAPVPPMITSPVNGTWMNVNANSSLTLTCTGSGVPVPNLTWTRDGVTIAGPKAGSATIGSTVGSQSLNYTIMSASVRDSGWFTCTGDRVLIRTVYTASSSVFVNVQSEFCCCL